MRDVPPVLANSLPRGGPFLLATALEALGLSRFEGRDAGPTAFNFKEARRCLADEGAVSEGDGVAISPFAPCVAPAATMKRWLSRVPRGRYIMGHVACGPALMPSVRALGMRHIVILRDPRAQLAALLLEGDVMPRFLRADFAALSFDARLDFMRRGGAMPSAGVTLRGFAEVYRSMARWQREPGCLVVRFEDLAGPAGGGDERRQRRALVAIAHHLGLAEARAHAASLDGIRDPSTALFRLAQIEAWGPTLGHRVTASLALDPFADPSPNRA